MSSQVVVSVIVGGVVALLSPVFVRPWLAKRHVIDVPNQRSSHSNPTIRGGGVALTAGYVVALLIFAPYGSSSSTRFTALTIGFAALIMAILGFCEDRFGIQIKQRAFFQIATAIAFSVTVSAYFGGNYWLLPIFIFGFVAFVNATNFMDGINGISGMQGTVIGIGFGLLGYEMALDWLLFTGLILSVVTMSFLPWNLLGKGFFLGDVGSYFIGALIAATAIVLVVIDVSIITVISLVFIYLVDTGTTLIRRVLRREQWYAPHRSHIYQRITDFGLSHIASASIVTIFSACSILVGLLLHVGTINSFTGATALILLGGAYIAMPWIISYFKSKVVGL